MGPAVPCVDGRLEPFPGRYDPSQLPVLREALAAEASLAAHAGAPRSHPPGADPVRRPGAPRREREHARRSSRRRRRGCERAGLRGHRRRDRRLLARRVPGRGGRAGRALRARGDRGGRVRAQLGRRPAPARSRAHRPLRGVARALPDARPRLRAAHRGGRPAARQRPPGGARARSRPASRSCSPTRLEGAELRALEPSLAEGLAAWRLDTGRPVPPAAAAAAFAARAREAGAELRVGEAAYAAIDEGRATGVTIAGSHHPAGAVAVAAGPWTPDALRRT